MASNKEEESYLELYDLARKEKVAKAPLAEIKFVPRTESAFSSRFRVREIGILTPLWPSSTSLDMIRQRANHPDRFPKVLDGSHFT